MPSSETDSVVLTVRVVPRASRSEIVGMQDGILKVRIASAPVDGAANEELIRLLGTIWRREKECVHHNRRNVEN